jgi:hypothetical protein
VRDDEAGCTRGGPRIHGHGTVNFDESIRILLNGTTGANLQCASLGSGVSWAQLAKFMRGGHLREDVRDRLALFVFRQLNAGVVLCEADRER